MTPEEIRQLADKQRKEFDAVVRSDDRRSQLRAARDLANFNEGHLPHSEGFSDEVFFSEWVNRIFRAVEILQEADLLKYLDSPTGNANEAFGVQVLNAAAAGDRNRCEELLRMGITDPKNEGIDSSGIRWDVWTCLERAAFPRVDPVAETNPLLTSIGRKPDWLPFDWSEAGWPVEPTVEAVLQLVDWLLLSFQVYSNTPAKKRALQQNGNY